MENGELKIGYCLSNGWIAVKNAPIQMILGAAVVYLSHLVSMILFRLPYGRYFALTFQLLISFVLAVGWWYFCLMIVRGNPVKLMNIFLGFRHYAKVWITSVMLLVMFFIGLILLVVPAIVITLKYDMSIFIILDSDLSPLAALKMSAKITKGHLKELFGLFCIQLLISVLFWLCAVKLPKMVSAEESILTTSSTILYGIGFLVIAPWVNASWATAYDVLYKKYQSVATAA
jgi:hypothetical protein